jgi:hypothetical protein
MPRFSATVSTAALITWSRPTPPASPRACAVPMPPPA